MTFPLFAYRDDRLLLFLEEPEFSLHPGLQRRLVDTLQAEGGKTQVFLTTHSNHLLDLALDTDNVSIFRFNKKFAEDQEGEERVPHFSVEVASRGDLRILDDLGARNSSVFLSNCTVWVEGVTDRLYIEHFLSLVRQEKADWLRLKESTHYSFVEYGGANVIHWSFLDDDAPIEVTRVCGTLMLVADADDGKDERHQRLAETLGDRFVLLPCREVENLLSEDVITAVLTEYGEDQGNMNAFTRDAYSDKYLGRFIDDAILKDKTKSPRYARSKNRSSKRQPSAYADESGTVKAKRDFQRRAVAKITDQGMLTSDALALARRILTFIETRNR
jgi:predicted ATP-dependent endonuclease of OLD family